MNKSTIINLSGIAFYIDENAYAKLNAYLEKVHKYFESYEDKEEIIGDIENRIAEKFNELSQNPKSVITEEQIDEVIESMGTTEDFLNEEKQIDEVELIKTPSKEKKKLYRDPEKKEIAGVAAGLAAYTGINVDYVRLLFIFFTLFPATPAFGIVVYILIAIFTPEAKTITERMEMTGEPVTITNIGNVVKKSLSDININSKVPLLKKILILPFSLIGILLDFSSKFFKHVVTKIIGIGLIVFSLVFFAANTFTTSLIMFQKNSPMINTPLKTFPDSFGEHLTVFLLYLTIAIPLIYVIVIGLSVIKRKYILKSVASLMIFATWIISAITGGVLLFNYAPEIKKNFDESNNHKEVELTKFNKVQIDYIHDLYNVKITKGDKYSIKLKGSNDRVKYEVKENKLRVFIDNYDFRICLFCNESLDLEIVTPELIEYKDVLNSYSNYTLVTIEGFNQNETLKVDSDAHLELEGKAKNLYLLNAGNTRYLNASRFEAENVEVQIQNTYYTNRPIQVFATKTLKLDIQENQSDDSIKLIYKGNPDIKGKYAKDQVFSEEEYKKYGDSLRNENEEKPTFEYYYEIP